MIVFIEEVASILDGLVTVNLPGRVACLAMVSHLDVPPENMTCSSTRSMNYLSHIINKLTDLQRRKRALFPFNGAVFMQVSGRNVNHY